MAKPEARYRISAEDKTRAATRRAAANFQRLQTIATRASLAIGGPALTGAAVVGVARLAEETQHLGRQIGASTELLSGMRHVGDLTNTSFEAIATSIQRMNRRTGEAIRGVGVLGPAIARMGIPLEAFASLNAEDKLLVLADAFAATTDETTQLELAVALFDTEGAKMLRFLKDGAPALRALLDEADALGRTFGDDLADASAEFNRNLILMKANVEALTFRLSGELLPSINEFFAELRGGRSPLAAIGERLAGGVNAIAGSVTAGALELFGFDEAADRVRRGAANVARTLDAELAPAITASGEAAQKGSVFNEIFDQSLKDSAGNARDVSERLKEIRAEQSKIGLLRRLIGDNRIEAKQTGSFQNVNLSRIALSSVGGNRPQQIASPVLEKMLNTLEAIERNLLREQLALAG